MAHVGDVVFALERFEWSADDRLEVVGRWDGLQGRRMGRAALTVVESGGRRRRLNALPGGQLAGEQPWRATFAWDGNGETVERAELELGRRLVVELPPPRRPRRRAGQTAALPTPAVAALEAELEDARHELARLREELAQTTSERDELAASAPEPDALDTLRSRLEQALAAREAAERKVEDERAAAERLRAELAERAAAPSPSPSPSPSPARLPVSRARRARGHGAHRVASHGPTVTELWGARIAGVVLAGLLLLALALVVGVVF
jgi:hypothetical protein